MESFYSLNSNSVSSNLYVKVSNLSISNFSASSNSVIGNQPSGVDLGNKVEKPKVLLDMLERTHFSFYSNKNSEFSELTQEISSLKQSLAELMGKFAAKFTENDLKNERLEKLALVSNKNKKKIKKLRKTVSIHQDKLMGIEKNLNFIFDIFKDRLLLESKSKKHILIESFSKKSTKFSSCRGVNLMIKAPNLKLNRLKLIKY